MMQSMLRAPTLLTLVLASVPVVTAWGQTLDTILFRVEVHSGDRVLPADSTSADLQHWSCTLTFASGPVEEARAPVAVRRDLFGCIYARQRRKDGVQLNVSPKDVSMYYRVTHRIGVERWNVETTIGVWRRKV